MANLLLLRQLWLEKSNLKFVPLLCSCLVLSFEVLSLEHLSFSFLPAQSRTLHYIRLTKVQIESLSFVFILDSNHEFQGYTQMHVMNQTYDSSLYSFRGQRSIRPVRYVDNVGCCCDCVSIKLWIQTRCRKCFTRRKWIRIPCRHK